MSDTRKNKAPLDLSNRVISGPNGQDCANRSVRVAWIAVAGSLLMFAAQPPLALGSLAWIAPVPWLVLIRRERLGGRRPYWKLWVAGTIFWFLILHWLRLPHPLTWIGWIALSCYLGCYLPVFVALCRIAVHRLGVPLVLAAPVVWTGLELVRAHMISGFLMASLAHTQIGFPIMIQISDLAGEYAVGFVIMLVAAAITSILPEGLGAFSKVAGSGRTTAFQGRCNPENGARRRPWKAIVRLLMSSPSFRRTVMPIAIAATVLVATLGYGIWRLGEYDSKKVSELGPRVALIQGNSLPDWKQDRAKQQQIMNEYLGLSVRAVNFARGMDDGRPVDLVVWPETMFRAPLRHFTDSYAASRHAEKWQSDLQTIASMGALSIRNLARVIDTSVLVGIGVLEFDLARDGSEAIQQFNAAVITDAEGRITGRYDKVHRVMFGEYIPLADWLPWLHHLAPVALSLTAGQKHVALSAGGVTYAPNICYESVLPHVIGRQVAELSADDKRPDVLVNLTNDAWYWGSSELDLHLACSIFRAVEMRTPHVVAANGGLTAHIDSCGRVVQQIARQKPDIIVADVTLDRRVSLYSRTGDWFASACAAFCMVLAVIGVFRRPGSLECGDLSPL